MSAFAGEQKLRASATEELAPQEKSCAVTWDSEEDDDQRFWFQ